MPTDQKFPGTVGKSYRTSKPWLPANPAMPPGTPNIIFIVLDDVGFAQLGCFGSDIETPNIDRLAAGGLRYANFHTTAMCSPTRASLLTGRNHHAVGMGTIADWCTGYPGYQGEVSNRAATLAEVLRPHGFNSFLSGKWHLGRLRDASAAGPFHNWPLGRGFDRFYGFMGAATSQWEPELYEDNHPIDLVPGPDYHLTPDLVDRFIGFIRDQQCASPGKPFFGYLAPAACHSPLHAPREYVEKYKGRFDDGWDAVRARWFRRQQELGIIPRGTRLTLRCPAVRPWEALSEDERRACVRQQEIFAGFLDHTDAQIARVVDYLEETGLLENTVIFLLSDNGASGEGGDLGQFDARRPYLGLDEPLDKLLDNIDLMGTRHAGNHYAAGWGHAGNTPLKWFKRDTHGGGIRDPLIVHWPAGIGERGSIRFQYHHCSDIVPTVLDILSLEAPQTHAGVEQLPVDGTSMLYSFADAAAPTRKKHQYFEMLGDRGIWRDGWKAVTHHKAGTRFEDDQWELYRIDEDFSESEDVAAAHPELLAELITLWWTEAERNNVLPLDDREGLMGMRSFRPVYHRRYVYRQGMARVERVGSPPTGDRSYRITADIEVEDGSTEGVLLSSGSRLGGYVLYVQGGRLVHEYVGPECRHVLESPQPIPPGRRHVEYRFEKTGKQEGNASLLVDGAVVATQRMTQTWPLAPNAGGLHCGRDGASQVGSRYASPFAYTAKIHQVVVEPGSDYSPDSRTELLLRLSED